ncbi:MAG: cbb3-type cytochrome c oxidase subunit I [Acidimicrobiales bacterium]
MTITETAPEAEATDAPDPQPGDFGELGAIVGTGDHKRIGRMFIGGGLIGLVVTLVAGLVVDLERISDSSFEILGSDSVLQVVGFHRLGLVLLFALPSLLGLALVVVPLQVGASTIAFPRAAALAFWGWAVGSALWIGSYLADGGPGGGDLQATDLWILSSGMVIGSLLLATVCVVTTVLALRTRGMTLARVPAYAFSMVVAGSIWLITLPVLAANLLIVYLDHRYAQVLWGANETILVQLRWLIDQPQIYALAIPVLGIAAEQIPVFAAARQRYSAVLFGAIGAFGALSIGAWAQPALAPDLFDDPLYIAVAALAVIPVLMVLALGGDTMRAGKVRPTAGLVMSLLAGLTLLAATATGVVTVIEPLELLGTTWQVGHSSLVVFSVALGLFAGLWFWAPKVFGRMLPEALGRIFGALLFLGALLATLPLMVAGLMDQVDRLPALADDDAVTALNSATAAGAAVALLAVVGLVALLLRGRSDGTTPDDPWGGHTLEWSTASPPVMGNFAEAPVVTDARPLFTDTAEEDASA